MHFVMASGDVYTDMYVQVSGSSELDFQPSAGVEVVITHFWSEEAVDFTLKGKDSGGTTGNLTVGLFGSATGTGASDIRELSHTELKLTATNSQYWRFRNNGGSNQRFAYCGLQTK